MVEIALLVGILVLCTVVAVLCRGIQQQYIESPVEHRRHTLKDYREDHTVFIDTWREEG